MANNLFLELVRNIEDEDKRKTFLIYTFGSIGVITSFFFTIDGYLQNRSSSYVISLISLFSVQLGNLIFFAISKKVMLCANILTAAFWFFCILLFGFIGVQKEDLKGLIDHVLSLAELVAKEKEIVLINEVVAKNYAYVDSNMIQTVLRNLIFNSIKFTERKGEIRVTQLSSDKNGFIKIAVTDTGVGMDQDQLDRLFQLRKNASTQGTENEKGTGLGLIICKEFIERHGGEIEAVSKPGKGSSFVFSLPSESF